MDNIDYFAECLSELMADNEMTVGELSEKTGIRASRIYDFLGGKHIPSLQNAIRIADLFGCPLDFLFGFVPDFRPQKYVLNGTVTQNVRAAMDAYRDTRYRLHKNTGIDESQLRRWYIGKQTPSLVSLITLARALDVSVDKLVGRGVSAGSRQV